MTHYWQEWRGSKARTGGACLLAAVLALVVFQSPGTCSGSLPQPGASGRQRDERLVFHYNIERRGAARTPESIEAYHSVEYFKLGLISGTPRYCYIVAPGLDNAPALLAGRGPGGKSKMLRDGIETTFPDKDWFFLNEELFDVPFSVVLSRTELRSPVFFTKPTKHRLDLREQRDWAAFREQYRVEPAVRAFVEQNGETSVRVELNPASRDIVVFDIPVHRSID